MTQSELWAIVPSAAAAIAATASAVASFVLVWLTARYVRLTSSLVEEERISKGPNVFIDIEIGRHDLKFVIGNCGATPAHGIKFDVSDNLPWPEGLSHDVGIEKLTVVKNGLSYLAPGRTLKYSAGYLGSSTSAFNDDSTVDVALVYRDEAGKKMTRNFSIGFGQYQNILYESFENAGDAVARAIQDAESSRSTSSLFSRLSRSAGQDKQCPTCGSMIPERAKKCPKCLEFIPEEPEAGHAVDDL